MEEKMKFNRYLKIFIVVWTFLIVVVATTLCGYTINEKEIWSYNETIAIYNHITLYSVSLFVLWVIGIFGASYFKRHLSKAFLELVENANTLAKSETKFRTLFETSPVPQIIVSIKDTTILNYNEAFANTLCLGQRDLIGKKADSISYWTYDNKFVSQILNEGFIYNYEVQYSVAGIKQIGLLSAYKIRLGNEDCVVSLLVDIAERKRLEDELKLSIEKAIESNHMKTTFLANMSHEIRSPMNGIIGFAGLLGDDGLSVDKKNQYIDIIQNNSKQLLNLINDIIDVAKIEAGQIQISTSLENINQLINELFTRFSYEKKKQRKDNVNLVKRTALEDEESFFFIDRLRVQQVLSNLLNNALKFTSRGSIEFGYITKEGYIEFFVTDTGMGIPEETQKLIFERFKQANANIAKTHGGTGLGLAICKGLVELMGGKIWVESQPDIGSTFKFTIPSKVNLDQIYVPEEFKKNDDINQSLSERNILIVEDIEYNRILMNEYLADTGATLIFASDGKETIEVINKNKKIDIVLLDIQLPDTNGYELLKIIKNIHPNAQFIAQTAYALSNDRKKAIEAGFNYYISKPIRQDILLDAISQIVKNCVN